MSTPHPYASAIAAMVDRMKDHPATGAVKGEAARLRQRAEALDKVNRSRSPLDTPAAHALKVAKMARAFDKEVTAAINRAWSSNGEVSGNLERRIADKVNFKIDREDAREIRAVFRGMKHADRMKALERMVEEGSGPEFHAIRSGTKLTTGVDDVMRAAFEQSFIQKHAAAEMLEKEQLAEVMTDFDAVQRASTRFVQELTNPALLSRIESEDAAAVAAGNAFNQSMQP